MRTHCAYNYCLLLRELKKLNMEAEDEITKAKDVQMLRVTKELQERLMMSNIQAKDQQQIETLEKTIDLNKKVSKNFKFPSRILIPMSYIM